MNELMIFKNEEFGQIRTVEIDGKPYFVGKDIANSLGYSNPRDAISRHCKGVVKHDSFKEGGQNISLIPEGDMYRLITHSKLESAERFESWVFDEVYDLDKEKLKRLYLSVGEGELDEYAELLTGIVYLSEFKFSDDEIEQIASMVSNEITELEIGDYKIKQVSFPSPLFSITPKTS